MARHLEAVEEKKYQHESEIGLVHTSGNTKISTINFKQSTSYVWYKNKMILSGHYLYGSADGFLNARNWDIALKYERVLFEKFSVYSGVSVEGNKFSGYRSRTNFDLGEKYFFYKTSKLTLLNETGYRYQLEKKNSWYHSGRAQVTFCQSFTLKG